jgi:vanillate O-demethylase ferredoxin subunit
VPFSCSEGICGTCLTKVVAGKPDHWDMYLTPDEQEKGDCMMVCCSRSQTARLVLEL